MKKELSSEGQSNCESLINLVRDRLQDRSKSKSHDQYGNIVYIDTNIYSEELLKSFVDLAISDFNQTPIFTDFTLENGRFVNCFAEVLVEGAALYALSSQALIERGREFRIQDDGLLFQPPSVSEMLSTQFCTLLGHHWDKLKYIKLHITDFA
jgi:hypothetical protein